MGKFNRIDKNFSSKNMTDKDELIISLLLAERLVCINEIGQKLKDVLKINSIFLGIVIIAFSYAFDKNLGILFIAIALLIFGWIYYIYNDLHYLWINSSLICEIEDEINAIIGQTIMKRENFMVEFNKKHAIHNAFNQFILISPLLLIYFCSIYNSAIFLSKEYSIPTGGVYLAGFFGIFIILYSIYHVFSNIDDDNNFLEEFLIKRMQKKPE